MKNEINFKITAIYEDDNNDYLIEVTTDYEEFFVKIDEQIIKIIIRDGSIEYIINDFLNRHEIYVTKFSVDFEKFDDSGCFFVECNINSTGKKILIPALMKSILDFTNNDYKKVYEIISKIN